MEGSVNGNRSTFTLSGESQPSCSLATPGRFLNLSGYAKADRFSASKPSPTGSARYFSGTRAGKSEDAVTRTARYQNHAFIVALYSLFRSQINLQVFRFVAYVIDRQSGRMSSISGSIHRVALIPGEVRRRALAIGPACCQTSPASQSMHPTALADRTRRNYR